MLPRELLCRFSAVKLGGLWSASAYVDSDLTTALLYPTPPREKLAV
jgi:hypothetical protein